MKTIDDAARKYGDWSCMVYSGKKEENQDFNFDILPRMNSWDS